MAGFNPPRGIVKNGKFYHVYDMGTPRERWVYVRDAAGSGGVGSNSSFRDPAAAAGAPVPPSTTNAVSVPPPVAPPPTPFFSADDLMSSNNFWTQWNTTFSDLDAALAKLRSDTQYSQAQLDQSHTKNQRAIADNAAARGLTRSSIKDANVAQETADYTRGANQLNDNMRQAEVDAANKKNYFNTVAAPQFQAALNRKAVENAQAASYNAPPPPPAASPPAPATTQASGGYKNVVKNGSFYHVYGYGTPNERWVFIRKSS